MSLSVGWEVLLWLYPKEQPLRHSVAFQGVVYDGEAVLLDQWKPSWGMPLEGDVYFRVVLLLRSGQVDPSTVADSRIAVCVLGRSSGRNRSHVEKELSAIAETRARYHVRASPSAGLVGQTLEKQQQQLEGRLIEEEGGRCAAGQIVSPTVFAGDAQSLFSGPDPALWLRRLAEGLLAWAYSASLLHWTRLPCPVTPADVHRIYDALFSGEERKALKEFGPGLGLSSAEASDVVPVDGCRVFDYIQRELERSNGQVDAKALHLRLSHALGLTRDLATLYLLAFVHYRRPEVHLGLAHGHGWALRDGEALRGRVLVPELVPSLAWPADLPEKAVTLHTAGPPSWNEAMAYTAVLCPYLTEVEEGEESSPQERKLLDGLDSLAGDALRAEEVLDSLCETWPRSSPTLYRQVLERVSRVYGASGCTEVYQLARQLYDSPSELRKDLELVSRLVELEAAVADLKAMTSYVEGGDVPDDDAQLSFRHVALIEQLSLPAVLDQLQGMMSLKRGFDDFKREYVRRYMDHHRRYQREAGALMDSLKAAGARVDALGMLNALPELGPPQGADLPSALGSLCRQVALCNEQADEAVLTEQPVCSSCRLVLGHGLPSAEIKQLLGHLDEALGDKTRHISKLMARRILGGKVDQRLEDFLKIVRISDLAALSSTLDADLVR